MNETPVEKKSYAMKMARADEKDIEIVQSFWDKLNDWAESGVLIGADQLGAEVDKVDGSFNRVFWGYQTLHDNACDKSLDYLDYKPEIKAIDGLLSACETIWSELKNKLASIDVHPGFPFADDSPCTVYFLDRIAHCNTMTEGIAKCDELMAEKFPDVYVAIAAARGESPKNES